MTDSLGSGVTVQTTRYGIFSSLDACRASFVAEMRVSAGRCGRGLWAELCHCDPEKYSITKDFIV